MTLQGPQEASPILNVRLVVGAAAVGGFLVQRPSLSLIAYSLACFSQRRCRSPVVQRHCRSRGDDRLSQQAPNDSTRSLRSLIRTAAISDTSLGGIFMPFKIRLGIKP